jgi:hypothetical protein
MVYAGMGSPSLWPEHGDKLLLLYRAKTARAAPANMPRPAVAMAAPPLEVELAPLELAALELELPEEVESDD